MCDNKAFLFSINKKTKHSIKHGFPQTICFNKNNEFWFFGFAKGALGISDQCNMNVNSYCDKIDAGNGFEG